jgi:hypothetical protein
MEAYFASTLARVIYEERVREGLARNAARRGADTCASTPKRTGATNIRLPRLQAVARSLIAALIA